jgi:membrane protein DedA with SNARE-associated domain
MQQPDECPASRAVLHLGPSLLSMPVELERYGELLCGLRVEIDEFGTQPQLIAPGRRPKSGMSVGTFSLLFAAVLANQAGVPLPVVPSLVAAGVLSAHAGTGMVSSILVTVVATLAADAIWYGLGRWRGREALRTVARLLRRPAESVDSAEGRFRDHQFAFLFGGRFVPELNPIASGMAGAMRMKPTRYSAIAIASALAWASGWTGAGYALGNIAPEAPVPLLSLATPVVVIGAIVAVGVALKRRRLPRHHHRLPGSRAESFGS